MKKLIGIALTATAILGTAAPASADPFVVVSPSQFGWDIEGDYFYLVGNGFNLSTNSTVWQSIPVVGVSGCAGSSLAGSTVPCRPGDIVDQSLHTPGEVALTQGTATIGGKTYSDVMFRGTLQFNAVPAPFPNTSELTVVMSAPFTFTGTIRGIVNGAEVFSHDFVGTGTTSRPFFTLRDGTYSVQNEGRVFYAFDRNHQTVPTPEPASMTLFGVGAAGLIAARKRGRSRG